MVSTVMKKVARKRGRTTPESVSGVVLSSNLITKIRIVVLTPVRNPIMGKEKGDTLPAGATKLFEYHCLESDSSSDADLWHRSHCKVTVGECVNEEYAELSRQERMENGCPLVYSITFEDGYRGDAWEDELLESEEQYERPDPPRR